MENYKDIIIRPIITEKTMRYMDADNKVKPKTKRMGKYVGTTKNVRKAYVKIKEGQDINLFGEEAE